MNYYKIVESFRNKINEHDDFLIQEFQENNDKNHWNLTCSAMDWLTVSAEYVDNIKLSTEFGYGDSIKLYSLISTIDIMWEAITQLYRVYIGMNIPFKDDKTIFSDDRLNLDDNVYFKHLRGVFGAHSVNITEDIKRFASWSYTSSDNEYDYTVMLYSSQKGYDDIRMGFKLEQLYQFINKRLVLLDRVIESIITKKNKFISQLQNRIIKMDKDTISQLNILRVECKPRFNMYSDSIDELLFLLSIKPTGIYKNQIIQKFYDLINLSTKELFSAMQNINYIELSYDKERNVPKETQYAFSKLFSKVMTTTDRPLFEKQQLINLLKPVIELSPDVSNEELFFACMAYYTNKQCQTKK